MGEGAAMTLLSLSILGFVLSIMPACLFLVNIRLFRCLPQARSGLLPPVSVLIPARNEERSIGGAVESVLACGGVRLELIVLDDGSTDATAALVRKIARADPRVRLETAPPLPDGWCGKQHACCVLSKLASHDLLVWIDADVRLAPGALSRMAARMDQHPSTGLLSGFPRQEMGTFGERLLIPLIHFVLLGFLPLAWMRKSRDPAFGAGCGQLFVARRDSYVRSGGHATIRSSLHDGIKLPRTFRKAGIATDLFDATDLASCRMYRSGSETWSGLAKNATEGMAAPKAILFWTLLLLGGQVLPLVLMLVMIAGRASSVGLHTHAATAALAGVAVVISITIRLIASARFREPWLSAVLHPLGIIVLLVIQWHALARSMLGQPSRWKGRAYAVE